MLLAVAAAILLSVSDPQGDALGDGGYILPQGVDAASLDIRSFSAVNRNGKLELRVNMARLENPGRAPLGFSGPVLDVFIHSSDTSGVQVLGDTGFSTPPSLGWQYHLNVNGYQATLRKAATPESPQTSSDPEGKPPYASANSPVAASVADPLMTSPTPTVHVEGATIVLDTSIPAGPAQYWVFSSLYSPLSANGVQQPSPVRGPFNLYSALANAPSPLDVLASGSQARFWRSREVPPVGNEPNRAPYLLISGLVGACLALGATVWSLFARR